MHDGRQTCVQPQVIDLDVHQHALRLGGIAHVVEIVLVAAAQLIPILFDGIGLPFAVSIAIGRPLDRGRRLHGQGVRVHIYRELASTSVPRENAILVTGIEAGCAVMFLADKEQRGADGDIGGELIQDSRRGGHRGGHQRLVLVRVGGYRHDQRVRDAPARGRDGHGGVGGVVEATVKFGHGDVALTIPIQVPRGQEGVIQPIR